jgi:hypothetical protein
MKPKFPSITIGLDLGDKKHAIVRDKFVSDHSKSSRSPPVVWRGRTVPDAGSRHAYNGFWPGMGLSVFAYPFLCIGSCCEPAACHANHIAKVLISSRRLRRR